MPEPYIPQSGKPVEARWARDLIFWIKNEIKPRGDGKTTIVKDNTVTALISGASYSGPLKLVAVVDSAAGTAQAKLVYGAKPTESFCGYYMHGGDNSQIPVVISENLVSGTNSIYLKLSVQTDGTLAYALVTSNTAANQTVYQLIGRIVFDATANAATVTQIHEGNLYLAGVV